MKNLDPEFASAREANLALLRESEKFSSLSRDWMEESARFGYTYNFDWFGVPIIQFPSDILMAQELIWETKPDVVVETGVARGGSICFYASMLALLDICDQRAGATRPYARKVVGVDVDIRDHTRLAIEEFPLKDQVHLIQGSSIEQETFEAVQANVPKAAKVMVVLDSNHTHTHVYQELKLYSRLVETGSVLIVFDTSIEFDDKEKWLGSREWGPGNSPLSALNQFLSENPDFERKAGTSDKLGATVCPQGVIVRVG